MTAAGVGLTLTAASTVLFSELHWTPGVLAQAEDRAHRIGQTHDSVQVKYMVCKDETLSLDMTMWKMLGKKIGTLGQVVDGNKVRTLTLPCSCRSVVESKSHALYYSNRIRLIFIRRKKVPKIFRQIPRHEVRVDKMSSLLSSRIMQRKSQESNGRLL
jgi:hypothetical protein